MVTLTQIDIEQSSKHLVVPGLIWEHFYTQEDGLIGLLQSEEFPSRVEVRRAYGSNFYHFEAEWLLPAALEGNRFTSTSKILDAAAEHLCPSALDEFKFKKRPKPEPEPPAPSVKYSFDQTLHGVAMNVVYFTDGSVSAVYTCPEKWDGEIRLRKIGKSLEFNVTEGPRSIKGRWTNPDNLLKHLAKARKQDLQ